MRISTALLPVITLLGLAVRLTGLGERSLWSDETFALRAASLPLDQLIAPRLIDNGNQLLFFGLAHFWVGLLPEIPPVNESLIRLLPLAFSVATIPVIYLLARRTAAHVSPHHSGHTISVIAAAFFAINPLALTYAQEFRGYSLQVFLLALSSLAIMEALRGTRHSRRWWATYAVLAALSVYAHILAGLMVGSQLVVAALLTRAKTAQRPRVQDVLFSAVTFGLLVAPLALTVVRRGATQISWVPPVTPHAVVETATVLAGGMDVGFRALALAAPALIILAAGFFKLVTQPSPWHAPRLLLLAALLIPPAVSILISLLINPVWLNRYMQFLLIPVAQLFAIGVVTLFDSTATASRIGRLIHVARVPIVLPLLATAVTLGSLQNALARPANEDWKEVARTLQAKCPEGEVTRVGLTRFPDWMQLNLRLYETRLDEILEVERETDSAPLPKLKPDTSLCLVRHWDELGDASRSAYLRQLEGLVGPMTTTEISFGPRARPDSGPTIDFYYFEAAP